MLYQASIISLLILMLRCSSTVWAEKAESEEGWQALRVQAVGVLANWSVHFVKFHTE